MASIERKLNECIARLAALAGQVAAVSHAVADIQAFLVAGSDEAIIDAATKQLKASADRLKQVLRSNPLPPT